jgi:protein-S-isoprenylcysteine O-methyltransferase Ste14
MGHTLLQKLFGVGPIGASISLILLVVAIRADRALGHPKILEYRPVMEILGALLILVGLALLFWTMCTLRSWWAKNRLCTTGPFRWFRHPMYAAWITFVSLGIALYLNSWTLLAWVMLLHPVWHCLVMWEEKVMVEYFQDEYRRYAGRTGRFVPRLWNPRSL